MTTRIKGSLKDFHSDGGYIVDFTGPKVILFSGVAKGLDHRLYGKAAYFRKRLIEVELPFVITFPKEGFGAI